LLLLRKKLNFDDLQRTTTLYDFIKRLKKNWIV